MILATLIQLVCLVWLAQCDPEVVDQLPSTVSFVSLEKSDQSDLAGIVDVSNRSYGQYSFGPVVPSGCGIYEGSSFDDGNGVQFDEFHGIRYAEPPVGPLRFRNAVPWKGCKKDKPYKATQFCSPCMQPKDRALRTSGMLPKEDCLCLSIYRPAGCNKGSKKPVLFYIVGGFFLEGSASQPNVRGGYLAHYGDMIVVTLNHRLGSFGFLYDGKPGEEFNGNMGYYDTVLAAKWVKEYIEDFGGDPDAITIGGTGGSGLFSAIYMLDPDMPKDLFRSVISVSPDWNQDEFWDPYWIASKKSKDFARIVGCGGKDAGNSMELSEETKQCLYDADAVDLAEASGTISVDDGNGICSWNQLMPCYTPDILSVDARLEKGEFLKGKSYLTGRLVTESLRSLEGVTAQNKAEGIEFVKKEIPQIIDDKRRKNINGIIEYYFGGINPSDSFEFGKRTTEVLDDVCNRCVTYDYVQDLSKFNKVYAYYYRYVTSNDRDSKRRKYGAFHDDDVPITFGIPLMDVDKFNDYDRAVSLEMISIWSDFVHGRKMKWPAFDGSSQAVAYIEGDAKRNYYMRSSSPKICPKLDA